MKYYSILILVFVLGFVFFQKPQDISTINKISSDMSKREGEKNKNILKTQEVLNKTEFKKSLHTTKVKNFFKELDIFVLEESLKSKRDIEPILAVEIKKNSIRNLKVGDKINLPYMRDEYIAQVTKKEEDENGIISVIGKILDIGDEYSVVLSEGDRYIFGDFYLPYESFEMELVDGKGYIYSINDIDSKRIDYSKDDFIVPTFLSML